MSPKVQKLIQGMRGTIEQTEAQVTEIMSQIYDLKQDLFDLERAIDGKAEHSLGDRP